jgi:hypothetical protein
MACEASRFWAVYISKRPMEQDILTNKADPPPHISDARIAMRTSSLIVLLAASVLTCTPILYYGVSHDASSLNYWSVGGIMVCSAALRLWFPFATVGFSYFNALLALWMFISAFIFDYPTAVRVHTAVVSFFIIGMSLASVYAERFPGTPIATVFEDRQGLQHQTYPDIGPDTRWDRY